ncbi:MAG: FAD-dependent pyridine nucleotide-disulfide oxidoreductase [Streptomyces oryziradicis]|nr:FAD-dependent pyridine nucleotide-disulfide oxidoreductase [Actinacidiphila oryziradicis]
MTGYGGETLTGSVAAAERRTAGDFRVVLDDGTAVLAERLLVTTGLVEPGDEAYEQLAARGIAVVDGEVTGLEVTGDRLTGVRLADGREITCQALVIAPRFTARTDVLTGLGLEATDQEMGSHVIGSRIAADPAGATVVPGVWVAGNVANVTEQAIGAASAGVRAAAAINADLIAEDTRRAVAARAPYSPQMERAACERALGDRRHGPRARTDHTGARRGGDAAHVSY